MSAPVSVPSVDLDARTKDELQPPCDAFNNDTRCADAAEWVVRPACPTHGVSGHALFCQRHTRSLVEGRMMCRPCRLIGVATVRSVLSVEPLR